MSWRLEDAPALAPEQRMTSFFPQRHFLAVTARMGRAPPPNPPPGKEWLAVAFDGLESLATGLFDTTRLDTAVRNVLGAAIVCLRQCQLTEGTQFSTEAL